MPDTQPVKRLEEEVKKMAKPLGELLDSIESERRPKKLLSYSLGDGFDDEFAKWEDDTPPPWMGEDRLL